MESSLNKTQHRPERKKARLQHHWHHNIIILRHPNQWNPPRQELSLGWICPIYKKNDQTEISNYRLITLLNTDYKWLTKVLAIQLLEEMDTMIHEDQTGFILCQSIFDNIRLVNTIINYAELTETKKRHMTRYTTTTSRKPLHALGSPTPL